MLGLWIAVVAAVEALAAVGAVSVVITGATTVCFFVGFNAMAVVTAIFAWHGGSAAVASPVGLTMIAMVAIYVLRMNYVLFAWMSYVAVMVAIRSRRRC